MQTSDFDFDLPADLIAQAPPAVRGDSRMLVLGRADARVEHAHFSSFPARLRRGDLVVLNDTRVFAARLLGTWDDTGGRVEFLLVEPATAASAEDALAGSEAEWLALCGSGRRPRAGLRATFGEGRIRVACQGPPEHGQVRIRLASREPLAQALAAIGHPPLPPYIRREGAVDAAREATDRERYQTVFARRTGAVAAPTAGLHFTPETFAALAAAGVETAWVTLHVGPGTFRPVKAERVEDHVMEAERFAVPAATAAAIAACRARGGRVVAVGSTTVRSLESMPGEAPAALSGRSDLFIRPPYRFRFVDAMLTNFHLPRSTLLMMVCALAGREAVLAAYREAVAQRYRFYSYGDCMLIA